MRRWSVSSRSTVVHSFCLFRLGLTFAVKDRVRRQVAPVNICSFVYLLLGDYRTRQPALWATELRCGEERVRERKRARTREKKKQGEIQRARKRARDRKGVKVSETESEIQKARY